MQTLRAKLACPHGQDQIRFARVDGEAFAKRGLQKLSNRLTIPAVIQRQGLDRLFEAAIDSTTAHLNFSQSKTSALTIGLASLRMRQTVSGW